MKSLVGRPCGQPTAPGINPGFPGLFPIRGQVAHVLLTLSPLSPIRKPDTVRLACLIHAASVHSEPGSNSPSQNLAAAGHRARRRGQFHMKRKNQFLVFSLVSVLGGTNTHCTVRFPKSTPRHYLPSRNTPARHRGILRGCRRTGPRQQVLNLTCQNRCASRERKVFSNFFRPHRPPTFPSARRLNYTAIQPLQAARR